MAEFGPPPQLAQDDLLDVLSRNLDSAWIAALLEDPSSLSVFAGIAAVLLRVQDASDESIDVGAFLLTAPGATPATSTVRMSRPNGAQVVVDTDHRFLDTRGMVWRPDGAYTIPLSAGPQTVDVPIVTERSGYWLNSFAPLEYTALDTLPDPTLELELGVDPASGGTSPVLDLLGRERSIPRAPGELDHLYRHRIHQIDDAVSPTAIAELLLTLLDSSTITRAIADRIVQDGLRVLHEPFIDSAQPSQRGLAGDHVAFFDSVFWDDLLGPSIRDRTDLLAWFDVYLPTPVDLDDTSMFWDDGYADDYQQGFVDQLGASGLSAAIEAAIAAIADELNRRRAAGVLGRIIVGGPQVLDRHPPTGSLSQAGAWTVEGATSEEEALESHDGADSYVVTDTATGVGLAVTASDLIFDAPAPQTTPTAITRVRLLARVRRGTSSVGIDPALLFVIQPTTAGAAIRPSWDSAPFAIDHDDWRLYAMTLDENPDTGVAWALADIAGDFAFGVANAAVAGPTDELQVSELRLEFLVSYE